MESYPRTALIIGATGLIGGQLLKKLLHTPYYSRVIVLTRRSLGLSSTKLTEVIFDFENPDTSKIIANDIFCCLGTTIKQAGSKDAFRKVDFEYPLMISSAGLKNGAEKFLIVTAIGADAKSGIFYNQVKGEVESEIIKLHYPATHILRPSLLLGDRDKLRMGEKIGEVLTAFFKPVMVGSLKKYRAIDSAKVANAMMTYAKTPDYGVFIHESSELQAF